MLCDHLEGWDREGGRETQEGGDMGICVCVWLIHFVVRHRLTALWSNYTPVGMLGGKKKLIIFHNAFKNNWTGK